MQGSQCHLIDTVLIEARTDMILILIRVPTLDSQQILSFGILKNIEKTKRNIGTEQPCTILYQAYHPLYLVLVPESYGPNKIPLVSYWTDKYCSYCTILGGNLEKTFIK